MTKKSVPPHSESLLIELLQEQLQASQETNRQLQTVLEQFKASQEQGLSHEIVWKGSLLHITLA